MTQNPVSRRRFLLSATGAMVAASQVRGRTGASSNAVGTTLSPISSEINQQNFGLSQPFFEPRLGAIPTIDPEIWRLQVTGLVSQPLSLSLEQLHRLPAIEFPCSIACASHTPDNTLIGHAMWQGISASDIFAQVGVLPEARYVELRGADGYRTFLTFEQFNRAVLAHSIDGQVLPAENGYPIWLIVPGLYSYKMPKWLEQIHFTDTPANGKSEVQGWSSEGTVQTTSSIYTPYHLQTMSGNVMISGMAYAGDREIVQVEVSVDDGAWMPTPLKSRGANSLVDWQIDWTPPAAGDYLLKVRATDSAGFTQSQTAGSAFPNGSSAIHQVVVRIINKGAI